LKVWRIEVVNRLVSFYLLLFDDLRCARARQTKTVRKKTGYQRQSGVITPGTLFALGQWPSMA
jgi:hypothetical protein